MKFNVGKKSASAQNASGGTAVKPKKKGRGKKLVALILVCAIAGGGVWYFLGHNKASAAQASDTTYTTAAVERRDITASITGSGTLEAANSYSVTSLVDGTILADYFEEGDQVNEDTVLYDIDSSDMASSLEQSEISLSQAQRSYNNKLKDLADLTVIAPKAGQVVDIAVEAGDDVSAGQTVATIRDSDTMTLKVPFLADEAAGFYVGQSAQVTLDSTFEVLNGTVTEVSGVDQVLTGNVIVRDVTIQVSNPGGLSTSQTGSATVDGCASASGGSFSYLAERSVTAEVSGTVASIHVSEGDRLSQGGAILTLTSDNLEDELQSAAEALRNAELSLESRYDQLDNYTIPSPISGTVIDKNYNAGENIETGQTLCSIYDLSYLTLTLNVDELDISNIQVGQQVLITAEAVEGRTYTGVVTKVSVAGTSSSGTTTYPVTIRIDETDGLLPGMNVDATITLDSAGGVLAIPSAALNRGNTVLVTADSPSAANGTLMEGIGGDSEQYYSVPVEVGVSDDSYIEIISGLQEGDTVAYIPTTSSGSFEMGSMMMIPGGGMGSVTISGGPGGGMGGGPGGF